MQELVADIKRMGEETKAIEVELDALLLLVPNIPDPEVPAGERSRQRRGAPLGHAAAVRLSSRTTCSSIGARPADFERAVGRLAHVLPARGAGALLELAVLRFALDHIDKGFIPMLVPHSCGCWP
jgi:seryl-tRNA synthetase